MAVEVAECPLTLPIGEPSNIIFQDCNITVYGVTVLPNNWQPRIASAPNSPNKRRRNSTSSTGSASPRSTKSKRSLSPQHTTALHTSVEPAEEPAPRILAEGKPWDDKEFYPAGLSGQDAETWRNMTIQSMYSGRGTGFYQPIDPSVPKINPCRVTKRLPASPRYLAATNYLVVGPALRGKFDPEKANALGVAKGPDRGRLTKGESVVAKDGTVVTPDMCMSAGSPPSVSTIVFEVYEHALISR